MSTLRQNVVANSLNSGWGTLISIVFVPVYLDMLGVEAYGLIGFHATLIATLMILDLGLSETGTREVARLFANPTRNDQERAKGSELWHLVRTLEILSWAIALALWVCIHAGAELLATNWLKTEKLPVEQVIGAIELMGLAIALQWPVRLYEGLLEGQERMVLNSSQSAVFATLRSVGVVVAMYVWGSSLDVFFRWQASVSAVQVAVLLLLIWARSWRAFLRTGFDLRAVRSVGRFAAGMTGINLAGLLLSNIDRILLSKLMPLEQFGYYSLASTAALALGRVITPIRRAYYPRLCSLVHNEEQTRRAYAQASQLVSVVLIAPAGVLILFGEEVMWAWTGSAIAATSAAPLLTLLAIGRSMNLLYQMPAALQLARGWTRLSFFTSLTGLGAIVPLIVLGTQRFGAVGAAGAWAVVATLTLFTYVPLMHRRLLPGGFLLWLSRDVLRPAIAAIAVLLVATWTLDLGGERWTSLGKLLLVGGVSLSAAALTNPELRHRLSVLRNPMPRG